MTDEKLPDAVENRSLFSDYYLQSLIQSQPQWRDTPALESIYARMKALYEAIQSTAVNFVEAQTERDFIQPVLELLGHSLGVQPTLYTSQGAKRPDYAFFADADALNAAQPHINTNEFFRTAIAVGDAKAWSRNLDRKMQGVGDAFTNSNPSYQIDFYLRETDKMWGILTNGREWRLYHRQTSYRLDHFYQVDLAALLSTSPPPPLPPTPAPPKEGRGGERGVGGEVEAFRYFYCLFRRYAFLPDAEGKCFLERVLEGSQQHTVGVSEDLKERVYEALRLLIGGFLDYPRNHFDKANPPLQELHENSLILLYRILFILYAESRGLLPVENRDYETGYSLAHLASDIHQKLDTGHLIISTMSDYWARLRGLSALINDGYRDPVRGTPLIPQYNGGLFNPARYPFLERCETGNEALAKVIDLLTRTKKRERIVYRDLEVRHLGSIYEGLLEYKPNLSPTPSPKRRGEQSSPPFPLREGGQGVRSGAGEVYLETDKGERKATGSYYTPDYIVRYIVENTLAPLCKGKCVDDILKLKVLDPAIGSGHFLVGAVDYLAEELATHPDAPLMTHPDPSPGPSPTRRGESPSSNSSPFPLREGGRGVRSSDDTEIAYWRRRAVESCIYGVDVNPMAVELAKLSLWLHTVARGEPLSFLDHHIRCGNSLIGAKIDDLPHLPALNKGKRKKEDAQTEFALEFPFTATVARAIGHYLLIETTESRTADQVHAKEHELDIAQTMLRHHKGVANLWTSVYFGNEVSRSAYHQALNALRLEKTSNLENLLSYQRAQKIATEKRFFHWEIEFPEVFRDRYGREKDNPGFDAVIGNPPYGPVENEEDKKYLRELLPEIPYQFDKFSAFMLKGISLFQATGIFSFIVPNTWLVNVEFQDFTRKVLKHSLFKIRNYTFKVFPEATVDTVVFFCQCCKTTQFEIETFSKEQSIKKTSLDKSLLIEFLDYGVSILANLEEVPLFTKCLRRSETLGDVAEIIQGIKPFQVGKGHPPQTRADVDSQRFVAEKKIDDTFVPLLRGSFIDRYEIKWNGDYWISYGKWLAEPRSSANFAADEKLIIRQTGDKPVVAYDSRKFVVRDNLYVAHLRKIEYRLHYLMAIMNSDLLDYLFQFINPERGEALAQVKIKHLQKLPIRRINFTTPLTERERLREKGKTLYELCLRKGSTDCVLGFVKHHLSAEPERSDVVHDLLAFLAEQMIEMNKAKGEEIRGFLRWLEREIGAPIDALKNKTAIQNYYEKDLTGLIDVLKANRRVIGVDASGRGFQEGLEREFNTSVGRLKPLMENIQKTDELIDQVVYQLYGLTAEEIAVVDTT